MELIHTLQGKITTIPSDWHGRQTVDALLHRGIVSIVPDAHVCAYLEAKAAVSACRGAECALQKDYWGAASYYHEAAALLAEDDEWICLTSELALLTPEMLTQKAKEELVSG